MGASAGAAAAVEVLHGGAVVLGGINAVGREKFLDREADTGEKAARILLGAAGAVLVGEAVVVYRHDKLAVALQTNDGELSQGAKQRAGAVGEYKVAEIAQNAFRHLAHIGGDTAGTGIHELHAQHERVDCLHHGDGLLGGGKGRVGREYLGAALASEKHDSLVEHGQPADSILAGEGLARDLIEIGRVHGVIAPVEADLIDIHAGVEQLCRTGTDAEGTLYVCLTFGGGVHAQILAAILVAAAIVDFSRMDAHGFGALVAVGHDDTSFWAWAAYAAVSISLCADEKIVWRHCTAREIYIIIALFCEETEARL